MNLYQPTSPDPRLLFDFNPGFLPACDGGRLPPLHTSDRWERLVIEFCGAYYTMNGILARIQDARLANDGEGERLAMDQLREASRTRDLLEDRCAPQGFFAEPVMDKGRYSNLHFMWAGKTPRPLVHVETFAAEVAFE
jgi:hypothetical protein